jgi:hypothetical protein
LKRNYFEIFVDFSLLAYDFFVKIPLSQPIVARSRSRYVIDGFPFQDHSDVVQNGETLWMQRVDALPKALRGALLTMAENPRAKTTKIRKIIVIRLIGRSIVVSSFFVQCGVTQLMNTVLPQPA